MHGAEVCQGNSAKIAITPLPPPYSGWFGLVDVEALNSLDLLLWLGRGAEVSERLNVNQSTVSRKASAAAKTFDMVLKRASDGWELLGDPLLVRMERAVHQVRRFKVQSGLRVDADPWLGPLLLQALHDGGSWISGRYHHLSHHQPLRLLRERVLDGWVTVLKQECLQGDHSDLVIVDLAELPLALMARGDHPLTQHAGLNLNDLLRFPRLNLASGVLPCLEAEIRHRGLWDSPVMAHTYSPEDWEGRAEQEAALLYGHGFTQMLHPWLKPLPYDLDLSLTLALVVHRDVAQHAAIEELLTSLRHQLRSKAQHHPDLELVA